MKDPGTALVYDQLNQKVILMRLPCDDVIIDCSSYEDRNKKADCLLEMLNVIIDGVRKGCAMGDGALEGISDTLMRIRHLISTE